MLAIALEFLVFTLLVGRYSVDFDGQKQLIKPHIANCTHEVNLSVYTSSLMSNKARSQQCYAYTESGLRLLLVFPNSFISRKTSNFITAGTLLQVKGRLHFPQASSWIGGFSEQRYLASRGVYITLQVETWKTKEDKATLQQKLLINLYRLQNFHYYWQQLLSRHLDPKDAGLVQAISLANGTYLTNADKHAFQEAGLIHVLVASGQHLNYFLLLIMLVMEGSQLSWYKRQIVSLLLLLFLACFYLQEVAFWRAVCQFLVSLLAHVSGRNLSKLRALSFSNVMLLLWQPYLIINTSFHLSVLACLSIYILQDSFWKQSSLYPPKKQLKASKVYPHSLSEFYTLTKCVKEQSDKLMLKRIIYVHLTKCVSIMLSIQLTYGVFNLLDKTVNLSQILGTLFILPQLVFINIICNVLGVLNAFFLTFRLPHAEIAAKFLRLMLAYIRGNLSLVNKCGVFSVDKQELMVCLLLLYLVYLTYKIYVVRKNQLKLFGLYLQSKRLLFIIFLSAYMLFKIFTLPLYSLSYYGYEQTEIFVFNYYQTSRNKSSLLVHGDKRSIGQIITYMNLNNIDSFDQAFIVDYTPENYGIIKKLADMKKIKQIMCIKPEKYNSTESAFDYLEQLCQFRQIKLVPMTKRQLADLPFFKLICKLEKMPPLRKMRELQRSWPITYKLTKHWLTKKVSVQNTSNLYPMIAYLGIVRSSLC